jgi:VanZ family protein
MTLLPRMSFWLCAAAVLILSLAPTVPEAASSGWDKSDHFLGFAALALLGLAAYPRRTPRVVAGLVLYGGLIEVLQSLTPYRLAEWGDWLADGVGVVLGLALFLAWRHLRRI